MKQSMIDWEQMTTAPVESP